jgi:hypothetical protein
MPVNAIVAICGTIQTQPTVRCRHHCLLIVVVTSCYSGLGADAHFGTASTYYTAALLLATLDC